MRYLPLALTVLLLTGCAAPAVEKPVAETSALELVLVDGNPEQVEAVQSVADRLDAELELVTTIDDAMTAHPDVIIGIGDEQLSDFDFTAASNLDQQFVLIDARPLEPTANLTSAVFRDYEGIYLAGVAAAGSPATVTAPDDNPLVNATVQRFIDGVHSIDEGQSVDIAYGSPYDFGDCAVFKRVDVALDAALESVRTASTGTVTGNGLSDGAVTVSCADEPAVATAAAAIVSGDLEIPDPLFYLGG
jgi:basic membrane lipoprotein Med (substrate-binding protein (PBP1-ABC) superfamily)